MDDLDKQIVKTVAFIIALGLIVITAHVVLTQEHYKVARYEVESVEGHRIYFDGGGVNINSFYYPIENDLKNLTKGDDIKIHYLESFLGGRTYIEIENLSKR